MISKCSNDFQKSQKFFNVYFLSHIFNFKEIIIQKNIISFLDSRYRLTNDLVIVIVKNMAHRTGFAWNGGIVNGWTHVLIRSDFMFHRTKIAHEIVKIFGVNIEHPSPFHSPWHDMDGTKNINLGKSAKSGAVFTGQRCVPHPYTMTQNEGDFCNGWIGVSFQTCKKMCWKNEIPEECTIKNPPGGCAYAVWHDNANHPGWCHLGQIFN